MGGQQRELDAPVQGTPITIPAENGWTDEAVQLLEDWCTRMKVAQHAYYAKAERLRVWNYLLGIPVVIVTAVVGTAVFASLGDGAVSAKTKVFVGTITVLAAVLASIQTFTKLGESAQQHGIAGDWYAAIHRDMEQILGLPVEFRPSAKEYLDEVRKEMNKASQKAPELGERWWAAYAQRYGLDEAPGVRDKRPWWLRTPVGAAGPSQEPRATPR